MTEQRTTSIHYKGIANNKNSATRLQASEKLLTLRKYLSDDETLGIGDKNKLVR